MRVKSTYPTRHADQHLPWGSDPIPGLDNLPDPVGTDLEDLILSVAPDAFWKLNEASGNTAHDSSGNSHDLTVDTGAGFTAPNWAQTAGPPGETTAGWDGSSSKRLSGSLPTYADNFTAGLWVKMGDTIYNAELLGQGSPIHGASGWALIAYAPSTKFAAITNGAAHIDANNAYAADTWYFIATVRDSGTWKLYVNGLLQTATMTTSPGTSYASNTFIGNDAYSAHTTYTHVALLSYAFIVNSVLTSSELLAMYEAGTSGGMLAAGLVWTSDGSGSASWQPATIQVEY